MARKVRFGLKNTKYAIWNEEAGSYGALKPLPWAVQLALSTEGGDGSDFYADDGICFSFAGTNGGYSGDLELANIPDSVRQDLLGEVMDDGTGVQFEMTDAVAPEFALVTEMQTDNGPIAFAFYNCKASRPEINANTQNDNPDVDTETLPLRIASRDFPMLGTTHSFVQGHIQRSSANAALYAAFFETVAIPTAEDGSGDEADATLSALSIGTLELSPAFSSDVTSYTATTSNATNKVAATASDSEAAVAIKVNGEDHTSGQAATWQDGENTVTVTVTNGGESKVYTVTVTKSE